MSHTERKFYIFLLLFCLGGIIVTVVFCALFPSSVTNILFLITCGISLFSCGVAGIRLKLTDRNEQGR